MNKHFEDAWYYARRTGSHLARGFREELAPAERRLRKATGREREELSREQRWRAKLKATEREVERRGRRAVRRVRERA